MIKSPSTSSLQKAESNLKKLKLHYTPYVFIGAFALLGSVLRYYLLPDWNPVFHAFLFIYQFAMFIAFWHMIKYINKKLDSIFPFSRGTVKRMSLQILLSLSVIALAGVIGLFFFGSYIPDFVDKRFLAVMLMLALIVVIMFNFAFYTIHFFNHWQGAINDKARLEIQSAELKREKSDLQYHQLKNQVNPHYLFNSLSSLEGLINSKPELASNFVKHMARVYRYILQHKEDELETLNNELIFIRHYISLLEIRYGKALEIHIDVSEEAREDKIVTVSLQMLIDNAIKHNVVQLNHPLIITIKDENDYLIIENSKQVRRHIETSNGMGLQQLSQLYSFLDAREMIVEDGSDIFKVKLPLIKSHG